MRRVIAVLFTILVSSMCSMALWSSASDLDLETPSIPAQLVPEQLVPEKLVEDLKFFTSEELRGRDAVEPTIKVAAQYISDRFKEAGLRTEVFGNSPFQTFDIPVGSRATTPEKNFAEIQLANQSTIRLTIGKGFSPLAVGANSVSVAASLVWVGYGVVAPEYEYDDYAGVDATGKVVVMIRKEPGIADPNSPFEGVANSRHAFFETKIKAAIDAGAVGVLMVNDPISVRSAVDDLENRRQSEAKRLAAMKETLASLPSEANKLRESMGEQIAVIESLLRSMNDEAKDCRAGVLETQTAGPKTVTVKDREPIPVGSIGRDVIDGLLREIDPTKGLSAIEEAIDSDWKPRSFEMPSFSVKMQVDLSPSVANTSNVVATVDGSGDLADQTVVIGAHYDHVGMGGVGSLAPGTIAVHNGADDNASGAATLIQVARQLAPMLERVSARRRVVFIAFTAEERGLLGSKHYVKHPRYPLSQTAAMINMDMVGRLRDNELTVYGTGSAKTLDSILDEVNVNAKFNLFRVPSGYGPSDHQSFYENGVPVLFFFTGLHEDYHRPSDDFEKLNLTGMARITDTVCQVALRLASNPDRPVYETTTKRVAIRRQMTVFLGVTLSQQSDGVILSGVSEGTSASEAGLQTGDKLLKMGKTAVSEIGQIMDVLRQRSPGDELSIVIDRGGQTLIRPVKLRAR